MKGENFAKHIFAKNFFDDQSGFWQVLKIQYWTLVPGKFLSIVDQDPSDSKSS